MVSPATDDLVTSPAPPSVAARRGSLTPQQGVAVARREVSVVLSSGAGCGKTHVLTERYLSHLRDDKAEVSQIVAITFTDRAARQMRDRIRRAVLHELREAPEDQVADWANHLRALESAQISTIHSFAAALLRQHAVEAGLDPQFEVLEDVLSANLLAEARTASLQELLVARSPVGADLHCLVELYGWRPTIDAVQHLVLAHDEPAWQAWLVREDEQIAAAWQGPERQRLLTRYLEYLTTGPTKVARCLWQLRNTECKGPQMKASVARLLQETPQLANARNLVEVIDELTETAKVSRERGKAWPSEEVYETIKTVLQGYREDLPRQLALFHETAENVIQAVRTGKRFLRVAGEVIHAYRKRKRRAGVLDFQDLLVLARNLLRDRPDVREHLQRRIRYLLVDELQDTDPIQMELVENLCGGGLTSGKLFAVGDHKQSIYRFRGADVQQFQKLRLSMPHDGRLGLTRNFRSQPAILHFANALFAGRLQDYDQLDPHHKQVNPEACIEFLWSPREEKENVNESRAREADWIAQRIAGMVRGEEKLVADHGDKKHALRPVRYGDVVLLFRAMSNVHLYEAALRKYGIDYYLVGGRAFFAQQEIYDLLNLLRALENPRDSLSLAGTLRSPFCCLSDEALLLLSLHEEGLWGGLHDDGLCGSLPDDQPAVAARARRNLDRWHQLKDRLPIARLLGEVFADSGYDAAVQFEFLGERKLANLWKLMDLARTFDRSGLFGLAEFIARLGDLVQNQPREEQAATQPENADVVRLMTIHQAKGLEFPIVFVPDLAAAGRGPHAPLAEWDPRLGCVVRPPADEDQPPFSEFGHRLWKASEAVEEWHEDLRTLYVACTRAQDYLVLSASQSWPPSPSNAWMLALAERFELTTGRCLVEGLEPALTPAVRVIHEPSQLESHAGHRAMTVANRERAILPQVPHSENWPEEAGPIPMRQSARQVFSVAEVLTFLREDEDAEETASTSAEVAWQFDTEDGSDRTNWLPPRERVGRLAESERAAHERVIQSVLERWDFSDPDGWRTLLKEEGQARSHDFTELEVPFWQFSGSVLVTELAAAIKCYRGLEYVLELPAGKGRKKQPSAALRGVLDFLWQDDKGGWHLLMIATSGLVPRRTERTWQGHKISLALAASALSRQVTSPPASYTVYHFPSGGLCRCDGRGLAARAALAAARRAVTAIAQRELVDRLD